MGPISRYIGPEAPKEELIWQDPVKQGIKNYDVESLKKKINNTKLSIQEMVETAWASASTFRGSDNRGGANGARIRLEPQKNWEANKPEQLNKVLKVYELISSETGVSIADIIILAGNCAIEKASGLNIPFHSGRGDATQEQTDIDSFSVLEPQADGFRNFLKKNFKVTPEELMIDKAQLLGLSAPEMTVLYGGLRSLGVSVDERGIFNDNIDKLTNNFFIKLLDMEVKWKPTGSNSYQATDRKTGDKVRRGSRTDIVFGSNSQLRALAEVYAQSDSEEKFVKDFIKAWSKVMNLDRFN
jgi:catalase-peroxidase